MSSTLRRILFLALVNSTVSMLTSAIAHGADPFPTIGTIERNDPKLDEYVPKDAKIEKLVNAFEWAEGPVWVKDGGYLLFSDVPRNSVFKWRDGEGISLFLNPSGYTGKIY